GFKFKSIPDIKSGNFREDLLVDVIGVVHELGSPQTTMGGKLKFPFTIKDLSANVVDCCLWDTLAA
ncbi:replication protein A1-like protein, partial [Trifolium medium]|nr:replication protein A1-like protein [Trifolium medium]